jgi:hypothetical protein
MHAKNRFVHQTPVRFDYFCILCGQSACDQHFRSEPRERGGEADHHIVEEDGIDRRKETLFLSRNNLRNQSSQKRRQHRFRNPPQPRVVGQRFLTHEPVKFRKCDSVTKERSVFLSQSGEPWQIGVFWRRNIPAGLYLRKCMLGRRPPENVFGPVVVCDEWMLQTEPICNRANACPLESSFSKLRNGGVQDRGSRLERSLLLGPFAWMSAPPRGHLRFLRHFRWLTQSRAKGALRERYTPATAAAVQSTSTFLRTPGSAARYPC